MEYVICTAQNFWSDTEAQILMDKFREYQHEVGPMKKFKNKKSMWEKISADILAELGSLKTGAQCENRYISPVSLLNSKQFESVLFKGSKQFGKGKVGLTTKTINLVV